LLPLPGAKGVGAVELKRGRGGGAADRAPRYGAGGGQGPGMAAHEARQRRSVGAWKEKGERGWGRGPGGPAQVIGPDGQWAGGRKKEIEFKF
jgi:hypothetical protein